MVTAKKAPIIQIPECGEGERMILAGERYSEWITYDSITDDKWLVEDLLYPGMCHLILGMPSNGKSIILNQLAVCLASGKPFLNKFNTTKAKVLLIDEDTPRKVLESRLRRMANVIQRRLEDLPLEYHSMEGWQLDGGVMELISASEAEVVCLDTLIAIAGGNLDTTRDAQQIVKRMNEIKRRRSVVLTHHISTKSKRQGTELLLSPDIPASSMGNTVLYGSSDTAYAVVQLGDGEFGIRQLPRRLPNHQSHIFIAKILEDNQREKTMWLTYKPFESVLDEKEQVYRLFLENSDKSYSIREAMEETGDFVKDTILRTILKELHQEGKIQLGRKAHNLFRYQLTT